MTPKLTLLGAPPSTRLDDRAGRIGGAGRSPAHTLSPDPNLWTAAEPNDHVTASPARASVRLGWPHRFQRALGLAAWLWSSLDRRIAETRTRHALARLDDLALKDIGLSRSDIESVSRALGRQMDVDARGAGQGRRSTVRRDG